MVLGLVARDGAALQGQRAGVVDAAALRLRARDHVPVRIQLVDGRVAGDGGGDHVQRAQVDDAAAQPGQPVLDRQPAHGHLDLAGRHDRRVGQLTAPRGQHRARQPADLLRVEPAALLADRKIRSLEDGPHIGRLVPVQQGRVDAGVLEGEVFVDDEIAGVDPRFDRHGVAGHRPIQRRLQIAESQVGGLVIAVLADPQPLGAAFDGADIAEVTPRPEPAALVELYAVGPCGSVIHCRAAGRARSRVSVGPPLSRKSPSCGSPDRSVPAGVAKQLP